MTNLIEISEYRLILAKVLNQSPEWVFMHLPNINLTPLQKKMLNDMVQRRLNSEPIAKILGYKEFYGRNFITSASTLDPRPDSETLIDAIVQCYEKDYSYQILDLGLGTGCLLFTLLCELPHAVGVGIDYSFAALNIAKKNQEFLHLKDRSVCVQGNWVEAIKGKFDLIVSNPPYIGTFELLDSSTMHDPHSALFSGLTGLEAYQKIIPQLNLLLKPFGKIFLEIGKGQELCVANIALSCGLKNQGVFPDLSGTIRVLCYSADNK